MLMTDVKGNSCLVLEGDSTYWSPFFFASYLFLGVFLKEKIKVVTCSFKKPKGPMCGVPNLVSLFY